MTVGDFVEDYSEDINDVFDDMIDHRFPFVDVTDRRGFFFNYLRSFSDVHADIRITYPTGINSLLNISYFLIYSVLSMLNRHRGGFLDDDLIRQNVLLILNECAENQFGLLYDMLFAE